MLNILIIEHASIQRCYIFHDILALVQFREDQRYQNGLLVRLHKVKGAIPESRIALILLLLQFEYI